VTRGHEEAVALAPAKGEVGTALGQRDEADRLALGAEHLDPVQFGVAHAPAAPEVAVRVDTKTVGCTVRLRGDEHAFVREAGAVIDNIVGIDRARAGAAVLDVAFALVR
jgi:hypothetical protein